MFLSLNGYELDADTTELENLVFSVARGEIQTEDIAAFFRDNCD